MFKWESFFLIFMKMNDNINMDRTVAGVNTKSQQTTSKKRQLEAIC